MGFGTLLKYKWQSYGYEQCNICYWPDRELRLTVDALLLVDGLGESPRPVLGPLWLAILSLDISFVIPAADTFGGGVFGV